MNGYYYSENEIRIKMTDKSRGDQATFALLNSGEQATSASDSCDRLNRTDKGEHITAEPAQTVREGVPASGEQAMATRIHKVSLVPGVESAPIKG